MLPWPPHSDHDPPAWAQHACELVEDVLVVGQPVQRRDAHYRVERPVQLESLAQIALVHL